MAGLDFSGITLPFKASDLLLAGVGLLGVVGAFVLLGMAFQAAPKLIQLIRNSFGGGSK